MYCAHLVTLLPSDGRQNFDNFRGNIRVKIATLLGLVCVNMNIVWDHLYKDNALSNLFPAMWLCSIIVEDFTEEF